MESNKKRIGLAIGGGGANGGYSVKLLEFLNQHIDFNEIKYVSGVSVGSLVGAFIVQKEEKILFDTFFNIKNKDVYKGKVNLINMLKAMLLRKNHISDISPLKKLLSKYISLDKAKKSDKIFHIGFVDMNTGEYLSKTQFDCDTNEEYINLLTASCSQPAIWQPQVFKDRLNCCDGGVIRVSPIGDIINYSPDKLIIINNSPSKIKISDEKSLVHSVLNMLVRTLDISLVNTFSNDIKQFVSYNKLMKEIEEKGGKELLEHLSKKYYDYVIFQYDEFTDSMNFESKELIDIRIKTAIKHAIWKQ